MCLVQPTNAKPIAQVDDQRLRFRFCPLGFGTAARCPTQFESHLFRQTTKVGRVC